MSHIQSFIGRNFVFKILVTTDKMPCQFSQSPIKLHYKFNKMLFGKEKAYYPFFRKNNVSFHLVCNLLSYVFKAIIYLNFDRLSSVKISNVK